MAEKRADHDLAFLLQYENVAWFEAGRVRILDRRVYPMETRFVICESSAAVASAIRDMVTQSAGPYYAAAHGMTLAAWEWNGKGDPMDHLKEAARQLSHARPTTASRMEAITGRALRAAQAALAEGHDLVAALHKNALGMMEERYANIARCAAFLVELMPARCTVMTQCFAETIVGMMLREAAARGKTIRLICPETRPFLQGARLTASVGVQQGCDVTVISDNMPGAVFAGGGVDLFTSAADVICRNGAVVNKVGTLQIACMADRFDVPYYVTGSPDKSVQDQSSVTIECRDGKEVLCHLGRRATLPGVKGLYPAFDITPPQLVTGIVTERGIFPPSQLENYFSGNPGDFPSA